VEGEPAHVGRVDSDTRAAQDQSPGGRIDQGRIRAKHSFQRWLELAYDMPLGERADPVHLHVLVEHPHSVRPQPGKRVGRALRSAGSRRWPKLDDKIRQH